jgi:hypothetical protein
MTAEEARELLPFIMRIHPAWVVGMVVVAIVASVDVTRPTHGRIALHVGFGTVAMAAVALIWLPALLRLVALTGGSLKAGGVEAQATGLLGLVDYLANIRTATEQLEPSASGAAADPAQVMRQVNVEVNRIAASYLPPAETVNDAALASIARRYEQIRREQPRGPKRTVAMTRCVNEARVRAKAAPDRAHGRALQLLTSEAEGDRIVGLAFVQEAPDAAAFQAVLRLFTGSATAFEAFHALVALERMTPLLSSDQRDQAIAAVEHEKTDPRGVDILDDPDLPRLMEATLEGLRTRG